MWYHHFEEVADLFVLACGVLHNLLFSSGPFSWELLFCNGLVGIEISMAHMLVSEESREQSEEEEGPGIEREESEQEQMEHNRETKRA